MEQEEMSMYQACPYCRDNDYKDEDFRSQAWYPRPYGYGYSYAYPNPYWYGGHHGWYGHKGGHRDNQEYERHDYGHMSQPMPCPMPCPMPMHSKSMHSKSMHSMPMHSMPIQPIVVQPKEKNYSEFKALEKKVNITQINNTVIQIEKKHPYMMKKLLMLGIAEEECRKILYLTLLCCGKYEL